MAKLNIENTRTLLQEFRFGELFIEELNWSNPSNKSAQTDTLKEKIQFARKPIAELAGATVYEITMADGTIPNSRTRVEIANKIHTLKAENLLIFIDKDRSQSVWHWVKLQEKGNKAAKKLHRDHFFLRGQSGDGFIPKLTGLVTDLAEFDEDGNISIARVAEKLKQALDVERVTKKFFKEYELKFVEFVNLIEGIDHDEDRHWYASVILNRLMFIYFLQKKGFIDNGNYNYLQEKLKAASKGEAISPLPAGEGSGVGFYGVFLQKLFFEGFAKPEEYRDAETRKLIGKIKYLNGGLFLKHKIELKYPRISIPDVAFENLFGLFDSYSWSLNDTVGQNDNEINPDVLGYIFEKYINQKEFGAYYTRPEITEYLCEQTVNKLILDQLNGPTLPDISAFPALEKKINSPRLSGEGQGVRYESLAELYTKLDAPIIRKLIDEKTGILPNLSLLDPACGSGAFLVAAMKTLINVYAAVIGRIKFLHDKSLSDWLQKIETDHPSLEYYIKKQIITNNLYGVDIMEEATEIAKLRLFLALVASAHHVDDLEPLPNIDFNIMAGNSLMGLMRVDSSRFDTQKTQSNIGASGKVIQKADLFRPAVVQFDLFGENKAKGYQQLINEKEAALRAYRNAQNLDSDALQNLKESIQTQRDEAYKVLNQLLLDEFNTLGIRYEEVTWDTAKNKEGKPTKRPLTLADIEALQPFHWGYEFSEIFTRKNGFDAIIANPPWEVFKPNSKEFFAVYSDVISKKNMSIKDFEKHQTELLKDPEVGSVWEQYLSRFPYQSQYYRSSSQFRNQISIVNGKKAGSDINFYKLFTEQSYNLLRDKGYCGIIIPSGIYSDLGSKQLRKLLFEQAQVMQLVSLSNERFLFENVDHRFKFCLLSFEKGGKTEQFKATFRINPREAVDAESLDFFLHDTDAFTTISTDFINRQSPDSLSVMEIRREIDFKIVEKALKLPWLGEELEGNWNLKLGNEFHMTGDSHLFRTEKTKGCLPLFEGKMMNQFNANAAEPKYWVDEIEGRKAVLGKEKDDGQTLGYQKYKIAHRAIARSSDSRTMIATILPKNCFYAHSLNASKNNIDTSDMLVIVGLLNSLCVDYLLRQSVSANLTMFYIYQLPVPRLRAGDRFYPEIVERAARLICTMEEFAELWDSLPPTPSDRGGVRKWSKEIVPSLVDRGLLRAELDAMVAYCYGLTAAELEYILSTFPLVSAEQKASVLAEFERLDVLLKAESQNDAAAQELIKAGESPTVEFKSTLRIDLKTNTPQKFIEHSVLKTIAAFLNSEGGTLLIGVEDNKNVLGLQPDFDSFSKPDKLDELQKHFDNLLGKSFGNHVHHYLNVSFPSVAGKTICVVEVKQKSSEPIYITDENNKETFYIRRLASTIDLKLSEATKYIQEHWK